jgi:regulator of replication initiation timing
MMITSSTPYSSLPPEAKRAIDTIHEEIMRHKKTMANVETMAPALLREPPAPADAAAGYSDNLQTLPSQLKELQHNLLTVSQKLAECRTHALDLKKKYEVSTTQSVLHGIWQVEVVANRRGIQLSSQKIVTDPDVRTRLQKLLDLQVSRVDRIERIPGTFMWETLADLEQRVQTMLQQVSTLNRELEATCCQNDVMDIASIVHMQADTFARVAHAVTRVHGQMEQLRAKYHSSVRGGEDVLLTAEMEERQRQTRLEQQAKFQFVKAAPASAPAPGGLAGTTPAPAPGGGGLFGSTPAPGATFAFGAAPAGGLFGSTPAATPATGGGFFGSTPTPLPAFGAAPAPVAGGFFGAAAAPAPAFGSTPAAAPATTPAFGAAPATGLFGAPAPATPTAFSFAGTATPETTSTASTPRASGGSRSRNRSRR